MSGIIGGVGSKSGVIGLDNHDAYKHSWKNYGSGTASISGTFDFSTVTIGSGITESAGVVTVSVAGTYLVSATMSRGNSTTGISFDLYSSGSKVNGTNLYQAAMSGHEYGQSSGTWVKQVSASATFYISGSGYTNGAMCFFSGIRIGA
tara:strand:- start:607 stop:1050 length:444 start_codon:yes stop_codon:yes gene_type:complete